MSPYTPAELEVMGVLWNHGALKPAEIQEYLARPLSNAALRSVLRVLLGKGHVTRRKKGRAYYYRPKRSAQFTFKKMSRRLAELFCDGSSFGLIAQLIKSERLSDEDIQELQRLVEVRTRGKPASDEGGAK